MFIFYLFSSGRGGTDAGLGFAFLWGVHLECCSTGLSAKCRDVVCVSGGRGGGLLGSGSLGLCFLQVVHNRARSYGYPNKSM